MSTRHLRSQILQTHEAWYPKSQHERVSVKVRGKQGQSPNEQPLLRFQGVPIELRQPTKIVNQTTRWQDSTISTDPLELPTHEEYTGPNAPFPTLLPRCAVEVMLTVGEEELCKPTQSAVLFLVDLDHDQTQPI